MSDLYKKHRPRTLEEIVGQPDAVSQVRGFVKRKNVPAAMLLAGPSGTGKTTVARVLRKMLECSSQDYVEINAASSRGIDTIREIEQRAGLAPIGGKTRVWVIDEAMRLTGEAQDSLLKVLEDSGPHCHFILCATRPEKLIDTIHTRCRRVDFRSIPLSDLGKLIDRVCEKEGEKVSNKVREAISEAADGSARRCLQLLGSALDVGEDEESRLRVVQKADLKRASIDLARILFNPAAKWEQIRDVIKGLDSAEDAESLRYKVLAYANSVLLGGGRLQNRAAAVIGAFEFSVREGGMASMSRACWLLFSKKE